MHNCSFSFGPHNWSTWNEYIVTYLTWYTHLVRIVGTRKYSYLQTYEGDDSKCMLKPASTLFGG